MDVLKDFLDRKSDKACTYREKVEEMLNSGGFHFAEDYLVSILDHIDATDSISELQMEAVDNIERSVYGRP